MTAFELDVAPLFGYLWEKEGIPGDVYLGVVQFGTETFYSQTQMNFSMSSFEARIERTIPDAAGTGQPTATLPVATVVSGGSTIRADGFELGLLCLTLVAVLASGMQMR